MQLGGPEKKVRKETGVRGKQSWPLASYCTRKFPQNGHTSHRKNENCKTPSRKYSRARGIFVTWDKQIFLRTQKTPQAIKENNFIYLISARNDPVFKEYKMRSLPSRDLQHR